MKKSVVSSQWSVVRTLAGAVMPVIVLFGGVTLWLLEVYGIF